MNKVFAIFFLVIVATSAMPQQRRRVAREISPDGEHRIVNGVEVELGEIPFQVSIRRSGTSHFCGGSIINSRWILCAAHCVSGTSEGSISDVVFAGITGVTEESSKPGTSSGIAAILQNARYDSSTFENDISLLYLKEELILGGDVNAIELPAQQASGSPDGYEESSYVNYPNNPAEGSVGTVFIVSGWGTKEFGFFSPLSDVLLKTNVAYVPDETCDSGNGKPGAGYPNQIKEGMICAGGVGANHDSCQGDSGGPMVLERSQSSPWSQVTNKQIGVVSWGSGCASDGKPGVYTQVSFYRNWIDNAIKCYSATPKPPATSCD